ncbi:MAG TPA: hypothetical protein VF337_01140 [Candidatus Limnocylindrales bacterium]
MHRLRRLLVVAMCVSGMWGVAVSPVGASPAAAASCVNQGFLNINSSLTFVSYGERYYGGGAPTITPYGSSTIYMGPDVVTLCTGQSGSSWQVASVASLTPSYYGMDSNMNISGYLGRGYGVVVRQVNATSIVLEPTMCQGSLGRMIGTAISSIPLPKVVWQVTLGKTIAGKALSSLPRTAYCNKQASLTLSINFYSSGGTWLSSYYHDYIEKTQVKTGSCTATGVSCYDVTEFQWRVVR